MSWVAVNSAEKRFLMILLGPVLLLSELHELPGQMSGPSHAADFTQAFRSPWGTRSQTIPGAVRKSPFSWEVKPALHMKLGSPH